MSYIDNLDKALRYVSLFSENLTSIPTTDLEMNTGIDIDELTEYLEELGNRGFVNNYDNASYITLQGDWLLKTQRMENHSKKNLKTKN